MSEAKGLKERIEYNEDFKLDWHDPDEATDGYQLKWIGKDYARLQSGMATETVIIPDTKHNEEEINKNSENLFFTGDNLEVLRHLQNAYANSVKMIYIDPPYNTGSEFIYNDTFEYSDEKLKDMLGLTDDEIKRLHTINGKSSHSAWLTFMYPRLKIARKLLTEDGVIFISIDDNEQANLKLLCDEIFGENNFVACAPRKTGAGTAATNSDSELRKVHDYVCIYLNTNLARFTKKENGFKSYPYNDEIGRYDLVSVQATGSDATRSHRPNMYYPIFIKENGDITIDEKDEKIVKTILPNQINGEDGRWIWQKDTFNEKIRNNYVVFNKNKLLRKKYCLMRKNIRKQ